MNLFYEDLPTYVVVGDEVIDIVTDFREYIRFYDMIRSDEPSEMKVQYILQYFKQIPENIPEAIKALGEFFALEKIQINNASSNAQSPKKQLYSFSKDFPFIYSAFKKDYGIDLIDIPYMHWWRFKMLFDGLDESNEIKKRIMYRGIDIGTIKDPDERKRIVKIQSAIALEENQLTDYDIGDVFW